MSSDDRTPRFEPGFRQQGAGMSVMFQCSYCLLPRAPLGRKKTPIGWRCAHCVRTKDAHKAGA